ncbi:pseudaminic acid cytidylyltransferase [Winogradskyella maritima]|uniref:Pseudaminic acid cytidylyltransferase n=1 Tax=Winogradskyella maritima TaxID=1517766 RepID=A0ABV8AE82_9FLAO|nr:pseudaminic acid cytidylyltransferase [Winogradskyella maritima]
MKSLAIIPARGGSKRIPRKNIKNFLGKPIIAYSIETAIKSRLFDEVMVSTDDEEIARVASDYGASVPFFRSKENADDFSTTIDVITEVVNNYEDRGLTYENTCCLYACAPFITVGHLENALKILHLQSYDCIFPVSKYGHPIQRALRLNDDGRIEMISPQHMQTRTQDLENRYHDLGQFYFFKTQKIVSQKALWNDNTGFIEMSEMDCHDIDTEEDWKIAEFKIKSKTN